MWPYVSQTASKCGLSDWISMCPQCVFGNYPRCMLAPCLKRGYLPLWKKLGKLGVIRSGPGCQASVLDIFTIIHACDMADWNELFTNTTSLKGHVSLICPWKYVAVLSDGTDDSIIFSLAAAREISFLRDNKIKRTAQVSSIIIFLSMWLKNQKVF